MNEQDYMRLFIERVKRHIERVNKYGNRVGMNYYGHDSDKLRKPLLNYYYLDMKYKYEKLSAKESENLLYAGMQHRITNKHHPEFWDKDNIFNTVSIRENPKAPFHCEKMPKDALTEMCADWCAMSEEFGNTPFEWLDDIKDIRFIFSLDQERYIRSTLEKMWGPEKKSSKDKPIDE